MWLGSEYDGVAIVDPDGVTILDRTSGLSDNEVKVMLEDQDGQLWLGTRYGVTVIPEHHDAFK
jgi:ligand-binding sensor domain-containing protein